MSDSAARPVSIELAPDDWQYVLYALDLLKGGDAVPIAAGIRAQIPPDFPTGVGAVIRGHIGRSSEELLLVRTTRVNREERYLHWRSADDEGIFVQEAAITILEILSPGVDL